MSSLYNTDRPVVMETGFFFPTKIPSGNTQVKNKSVWCEHSSSLSSQAPSALCLQAGRLPCGPLPFQAVQPADARRNLCSWPKTRLTLELKLCFHLCLTAQRAQNKKHRFPTDTKAHLMLLDGSSSVPFILLCFCLQGRAKLDAAGCFHLSLTPPFK